MSGPNMINDRQRTRPTRRRCKSNTTTTITTTTGLLIIAIMVFLLPFFFAIQVVEATTPSSGCSMRPVPRDQLTNVTIKVDGIDRRFLLYVPATTTTTTTPVQPRGLVLNFHGTPSTADLQYDYTELDLTAKRYGFIVAYPQGIDDAFNAGGCCAKGNNTSIDDEKFSRLIVKHVGQRTCVDLDRVYAVGWSNGGYMSYYLACRASDVFSAIVPVAGLIGIDPQNKTECNPTTTGANGRRRVPRVLHFHEVRDDLVGYCGPDQLAITPGPNTNQTAPMNEFMTAPELVSVWAKKQGCSFFRVGISYKQGEVTCRSHMGCPNNQNATLCTILRTNATHSWPGDTTGSNRDEDGTRDILGNDQIWRFLAQLDTPANGMNNDDALQKDDGNTTSYCKTKFTFQRDFHGPYPPQRQQQTITALKTLEGIVADGDLADGTVENHGTFCNNAPTKIDDIFICCAWCGGIPNACPNVTFDSGTMAMSTWSNPRSENPGKNIPLTGQILVNSAAMNSSSPLDFMHTIEHMALHVMGVGDNWFKGFDFVAKNPNTGKCEYRANTSAAHEFQRITGCPDTTPIPVQPGNPDEPQYPCFDHWDPACFGTRERMSPSSDSQKPAVLSSITVGSLEDLGYKVDYEATGVGQLVAANLSSSCVCGGSMRGAKTMGESPQQQPLSTKGRMIAKADGLAYLAMERAKYEARGGDAALQGGHQSVLVLYKEGQMIHDIMVHPPK